MADQFYDVRNALTLGNYHQAIAEASGVKTSSRKADEVSAFNAEKEMLIALAQIGLGQGDAVISQLSTATHPTLRSLRSWAEFTAAMRAARPDTALPPAAQSALAQLTEIAEKCEAAAGRVACVSLAAGALLAAGDVSAALSLAKRGLAELCGGAAGPRQLVELHAVAVEALLRIRRVDLARAEVKAMEQRDDESVLTVLCSGVVSLHEGVKSRDAYQAAQQRFKELAMRGGPSVLAHNLTALAFMGFGDFAAAERSLLDALAMKSGDADTTANLAVVSAHLGKSADATNRYIQQGIAIPGMWSSQFAAMSARLDEAVAQFEAAA